MLTWDQKDDSGNQVPPGWYYYYYNLKGVGVGSASAFFIQYPQGAMVKTIQTDQSQTISGFPVSLNGSTKNVDLFLTLKSVYLTEKSVGFFVTATSTDPQVNYNDSAFSSPYPQAHYVIDGVSKTLFASNTNVTASGIEWRWGAFPGHDNFNDPVPSDAKNLGLVITRIGQWQGNLEFKIPLGN